MRRYIDKNRSVTIYNEDSQDVYNEWEKPVTIISDGPYGVKGFPGDPPTYVELPQIYEPHIKKWSELSTPQTTLWFWNTEIGWAMVHPILEKYGWQYKSCNTWNKGIKHVAGNANSKTLSHLPKVTEVCVQYVKRPYFKIQEDTITMQEWLRYEWKRTGLPFSKTNEACGVKNAASRKYFTSCHLWYMPPSNAFARIVEYANQHGRECGKPYFSIDGIKPMTKEHWDKLKPKFYCPHGITNVWDEPPLRNGERIKVKSKSVHLNQKPLKLMELIIKASSDEKDVVWEPFGGLCSATAAAFKLNRIAYAAEISEPIYDEAVTRIKKIVED